MGAPTAAAPPAALTMQAPEDLEVQVAGRSAGTAILVLAVLSGFGVFIATLSVAQLGPDAPTTDAT